MVNGRSPRTSPGRCSSYLGELPGYDPTLPLEQAEGRRALEAARFRAVLLYRTFTQLAVSLGHIFRVEQSDIDMRDVVLNRRILVVNLPALENSDATLAALGKLVVASLRGMMAQLLGASPRGGLQRRPTSPGWARRPSLSSSTRSPITRRAAWTACWRWAAA